MTTPAGTTRTASGPRAHARPGRAGNGQWAMGYREPLNANEQVKKDDNPLNVRARIENIYAHRGFASIDPADLRGRMRWFGLYTQRKPGIDGGRTAALEPHELDDEYFMLRVRIDGGALTSQQLRVIGDISAAYARGSADLTDRQNIQLHWIRIEDVPAIWRALEAVGLDTTEACGDCPRVVLGSPVAGIAADEIIDPLGPIEAIKSRWIGVAGVRQPAAQVQDRDQRPRRQRRRARAQRHLVRRGRAPRARPRLRPLGRRRAVDQPATGRAARRLRCGRRGSGGLGRRRLGLPGLRLPPAAAPRPAEVPGRRLGRREVPRGAREGLPRPGAARRPGAGAVGRPRRRRRCARAEGRPVLRRRRAARSAGSPAASCRGWPTSSRPTARTGCARRRTRSCSSSTSRPTRSSR